MPEVGVIAINGKLINEDDTSLNQGDHVDIFPLIGGG
jgi:molybdopterin converting factor small subunit